MKWILVLLVALAHSGWWGVDADPGNGLLASLPLDLNFNHPYVQVQVNGSEPLSFMLDTGAQVTVIDREVANRIGLRSTPIGRSPGAAASEPRELGLARGVIVELDSISAQFEQVYVMPVNRILARHEGREVHGRLGSDFLSRYVVEVDYAEGVIRLYDPALYRYEGSGAVVPLMLESRRPAVRATIAVPGAEAAEGLFVLNTSATGPIYLSTIFVVAHRLLSDDLPLHTGFVAGMGALDQQPIGRADSLTFEGVLVENPLVYFSQHPLGGLAAQFGADGVIGGEILRRFTVTWDYPRSRVTLDPNERIDEPFTHAISDLSGFYLLANNVALDSLWVEEIVPDGPADEAGVQTGDVILSIDGIPTAQLTLEEIRQLFLRETTYRLRIDRRGKVVDIVLPLNYPPPE